MDANCLLRISLGQVEKGPAITNCLNPDQALLSLRRQSRSRTNRSRSSWATVTVLVELVVGSNKPPSSVFNTGMSPERPM